jgi:hypothetical protein
VIAVERDPELLAELVRRAASLPVTAVAADARRFRLSEPVELVLAPMQLVQLLDPPGRRSLLDSVASALRPGALLAIAITAEDALPEPGDELPALLPDVREIDDWVYSSLPVALSHENGALEIRRLRQVVSPQGDLTEELDVTRLQSLDAGSLEEEAESFGLRPAGRRDVAATDDHSGSTVLLLERRR